MIRSNLFGTLSTQAQVKIPVTPAALPSLFAPGVFAQSSSVPARYIASGGPPNPIPAGRPILGMRHPARQQLAGKSNMSPCSAARKLLNSPVTRAHFTSRFRFGYPVILPVS